MIFYFNKLFFFRTFNLKGVKIYGLIFDHNRVKASTWYASGSRFQEANFNCLIREAKRSTSRQNYFLANSQEYFFLHLFGRISNLS